MKFKIIILALVFSIFVLALETDSDLQRNILKFHYSINYKYEGELSHCTDIFYIYLRFQLPKLNDILIIFQKMPVDYKNFDYLSPHNSTKHADVLRDIKNGQAQYICNQDILLTRKLDTQYQQYYKTIQKTLLKEILLLVLKFEEPKRCKRGTIGILFKAVVNIASEAVSPFIWKRKRKALYKLLAIRKLHNFLVNRLEYLK